MYRYFLCWSLKQVNITCWVYARRLCCPNLQLIITIVLLRSLLRTMLYLRAIFYWKCQDCTVMELFLYKVWFLLDSFGFGLWMEFIVVSRFTIDIMCNLSSCLLVAIWCYLLSFEWAVDRCIVFSGENLNNCFFNVKSLSILVNTGLKSTLNIYK